MAIDCERDSEMNGWMHDLNTRVDETDEAKHTHRLNSATIKRQDSSLIRVDAGSMVASMSRVSSVYRMCARM